MSSVARCKLCGEDPERIEAMEKIADAAIDMVDAGKTGDEDIVFEASVHLTATVFRLGQRVRTRPAMNGKGGLKNAVH